MPDIVSPSAQKAPRPAWHRRLLTPRAAAMLLRNSLVSCSVFAFGIGLMWVMIRFLGVNPYAATAISFLLTNSAHYAFARTWIFRGTQRALGRGYVYFFLNAGVGLAVTMALFAVFTEWADMHFIGARVIASLFAGLAAFALNALLNFESL
ncbi:MAG: GtrA family protein [Sphingobium sp.]